VSLTRFLLAWRTIPLRDREVIDALVHPSHAGPSAELSQALQGWRGSHYWSDEADGRHLVLTQAAGPRPGERWVAHAVLFALTLFTTTLGGAVFAGAVGVDTALTVTDWGQVLAHGWSRGLVFSLPLLAILMCHELGHYLTARRYLLDVSPPYFLPGPPLPIGTLGAFIRLRTILTDRRQLIDVGAAGPFAGFLIALPLLWIGFALSRPAMSGTSGMEVWAGNQPLWQLGDSIITRVVRFLAMSHAPGIVLHPVAVAGWFGMFVTALNLLPIAQLDGGHILYSASPGHHEGLGRGFWIVIMLMGWFWLGWLIWGSLVLVLSRGRLGHPPVLDSYRPLPRSRRWLAWASLVLFLVTFAPVPLTSFGP
jgi:membrane-associated protease RseP (regulator of RpoE activity)